MNTSFYISEATIVTLSDWIPPETVAIIQLFRSCSVHSSAGRIHLTIASSLILYSHLHPTEALVTQYEGVAARTGKSPKFPSDLSSSSVNTPRAFGRSTPYPLVFVVVLLCALHNVCDDRRGQTQKGI